ncbi:MAG TPA: hypothetical protein VL179_06580, partial [Mycobacterium sp.]|nr:hypothetical protein [Mycobacterium sp.]
MATVVQKFVNTDVSNGDGTSGAPWSSLDNAMTGLASLYASGLVTADVQVDLFCAGATQDTAPNTSTGVNVSIATDATRYLRILAGVGQSAQMPYSTGRYRLVQTNGFRPCLTVATTKLVLQGLQFRNTGLRANSPNCLSIPSTAGRETYVYGCYGDFTGVDTPGVDCAGVYLKSTGTNHKIVVRNSVMTGARVGFRRAATAAGSVTILDNNTAVANSLDGFLVDCSAGTTLMRNNVATGNTTADYSFNGAVGLTTAGNRSGDASSPDVAGQSKTFTFVSSGTGDYHLDTSDLGAIGAGTDLTADSSNPFSDDFDGEARVAPWDSGADQASTGGGGGGTFAR